MEALGALEQGNYKTAANSLTGAVSGLPFKASWVAQPIGAAVSPFLKDSVDRVIPAGTKIYTTRGGTMQSFPPQIPGVQDQWVEREVLFPMPWSFVGIQPGDPSYLHDLQQLGMIS